MHTPEPRWDGTWGGSHLALGTPDDQLLTPSVHEEAQERGGWRAEQTTS